MKRKLFGIALVLAVFLAAMLPGTAPMAGAAPSGDMITAAYAAYYKLLKTAVEDHVIDGFNISEEQISLWSNQNAAESVQGIIENTHETNDVVYAELIDFNNDGLPEFLLCTEHGEPWEDGGRYLKSYFIFGYSGENQKADLYYMFTEAKGATYHYYKDIITRRNGEILYREYMRKSGYETYDYSTVRNGKWVEVFCHVNGREINNDTEQYYWIVDGNPQSEQEYSSNVSNELDAVSERSVDGIIDLNAVNAVLAELESKAVATVQPTPPASTTTTTPPSAEKLLAAYRAYYDVLKTAVDAYGFSNSYQTTGVCYSELIDFDNDGLPELLYFTNDVAAQYQEYHVYGYKDGLVNFYRDQLWLVGMDEGAFYICDGRDKRYLHRTVVTDEDHYYFYTVKYGEWVKALTRTVAYGDSSEGGIRYYVNSDVVNEQVFNEAETVLNIVNTCRIDIDVSTVATVLAELEARIAALEGAAEPEAEDEDSGDGDSGDNDFGGGSLYNYEPLTPRGGFIVRPGELRGITDAASANSAIFDAIASMTPEQRKSGDALDVAALFIENAMRAGASREVSGEVSLSASVLSELVGTANSILASAGNSLEREGVGLLRGLRTGVMVRTDAAESLVVTFPDDVSGIGFDSVTIEAPFASVTLSRGSILSGGGVEVVKGGVLSVESGVAGGGSDGSGETGETGESGGDGDGRGGVRGFRPLDFWSVGVVALVLIVWGVLAAMKHKFRAWVVPTFCALAVAANVFTFFYFDNSDIENAGGGVGAEPESSETLQNGDATIEVGADRIEITLSEGVRATVSLPAVGGDKDSLVLLSEDGEPQYSKYNPVTDMVDTRVRESGVYTLCEYTVSFVDVEQKNELMKEAITQLASRGIMTGTTDGYFLPDSTITRAQLVTAIVRAFDLLDPEAVSGFADLDRSDWFYTAVATAERENIISGYEDNTFRGDVDIPKDQLIAISANTLIERMGYIVPGDIEGQLSRYLDREALAQWSEGRIALATQSNILIYRLDNMFAPRSIMTRGDAAIVLYRVFNKVW